VSSELAEDAVAFDKQLSTAMSAALASGLDGAFISGTGAGQPLGILNSPALKVISKVTTPAQSTGTLFVINLASMLAGLTPGSYARSTWLVHPTVVPHLVNLQSTAVGQASADVIGITTSNAVSWDGAGNIRIFGRPCIVSDSCAAFSSANDILLCDLSQYIIGMRRDAVMEVDRSVYFASDEIGFRLTLRLDGMPAASAATKLRDGTLTVSPFVAMGAR
jgi:HK97 family phage major capsid protein